MDQTSDAISEHNETEPKEGRHPVITRRVFRQMSAPQPVSNHARILARINLRYTAQRLVSSPGSIKYGSMWKHDS